MHEQATATVHSAEAEEGYPELERLIAARVADLRPPLFRTDAADLYDVFLTHLPEDRRQHYQCRNCRKFVEDFGGLVTVHGHDGATAAVVWNLDDELPFFDDAIRAVVDRVIRAKITGVFFNDHMTWGVPENVAGPGSKCAGQRWTHLHGHQATVRNAPVFGACGNMGTEQCAAEKTQDFIMLKRALSEFSAEAVSQALRVLKADALDRGEKALGVAEWLAKLHESIKDKRGRQRDNVIWLAVAGAPPGFCHVRGTMIGTLLDDIVAGVPFEAVKRRWADKMHPLQYQRPTAPPSEGTIEQAEALVKEMGLESALRRRFAALDDIKQGSIADGHPWVMWTPTDVSPQGEKSGGVFDHLRRDKEKVAEQIVEASPMTWDKFRRTVLPEALALEFYTGGAESRGLGWSAPDIRLPFFGMTTAADQDAKPILQWDGLPDRARNPHSWYFYNGGSLPYQWDMAAGAWVKVNAVVLQPNLWQNPDRFRHHSEGAFFILDGCRDMRRVNDNLTGGGFFPESLRTELHGVRAVLEAHVRQAVIEGADVGTANGVAFQKGQTQSLLFRARTRTGVVLCKIDRWD